MFGVFEHGFGMGMARLSGALSTLAENLRSAASERMERLGAAWRAEVQRVAVSLVLALVLAFFICGAAAFAMFAFMLSFWDSHRILAAWLITVCFAVLAWIAAVLLRGAIRADERSNG